VPVPPSGSPTLNSLRTKTLPPTFALMVAVPGAEAAIPLFDTWQTSLTVAIAPAPPTVIVPTEAVPTAMNRSSAEVSTPPELTFITPLPRLPTNTSPFTSSVSSVDALSALAPTTSTVPLLPAKLPRMRSSETRASPPSDTLRFPAPRWPTNTSEPAFCTWNSTFDPLTTNCPTAPASPPIVHDAPAVSTPLVWKTPEISPVRRPIRSAPEMKCGAMNCSVLLPAR
jgi:hypothetical protein